MSAFLDELKRRGVMRAAALYAVVAWAIIESSATILPALGIPEWTVTAIIVIALAGFPFCLVGAWIFDFTRGGIVRTPQRAQLDASELQRVGRGRLIDFVIIAVLGVAVVWLGWERLQRDDSADPVAAAGQSLDSIAVLPFANISDDPANEYFGDGLAEELLNVLVKIDGLRVTARTSSFQYRGQNLDIREIGRALGVATVLEGSVRKFGDKIRVTAQLIRADDGFHLWSETYDSDLADIFAVQDRISLAIAEALRGTLSPSQGAELTESKRQTVNVAAFEAYLRGRFAMNKRTADGLAEAVEDFRQAIALDPNYAAAFSGLSDTYMLQASYADRDQREALRLAEPMMQQAITLDPNLAEAQASKGFVLGDQGDHEGAIAAFKRAIELNPSYSPAYHWLALRYQNDARFNEAKRALQDCLRVDPGYTTGKRVLLGLLRSTGEDEQANALAEQMASDHANDSLVLYTLSEDAVEQNQLVDAVRFGVEAVKLQPESALLRVSLAQALAVAGDTARAEAQIEVARELAPDNPNLAQWPMLKALAEGDFEALERLRAATASDPGSIQNWPHMNCMLAARVRRVQSIIEACGAILKSAQWQPDQPLPDPLQDNVAALLSAYDAIGDEEAAEQLAAAVDAELDRLEANGMGSQRVAFYRAHMAMYRGDPEALLERLPHWLDSNNISAASLRTELVWDSIRDDPRFQTLITRTERRQAEILAEVKAIAVP